LTLGRLFGISDLLWFARRSCPEILLVNRIFSVRV
jgi:hypothetical protein